MTKPSFDSTALKDFSQAQGLLLTRYAESTIPTEYGFFRVICYREYLPTSYGGERFFKEHLAVVKGQPEGKEGVLARVHSECLTGEVLHSLKCDCREQLDYALRAIASANTGVVLYLRQEGRGIGLGNKIRAYALQEKGVDTVDANRMLGFPDDARRFDVAARMLADLEVRSIVLLTNNPYKVKALREEGVQILRREPVPIHPNRYNAAYLHTKGQRMGHELMGHPMDESKAPPVPPHRLIEVPHDPQVE
ncbi:MAG: GTP cyclohydrolase II [Sandaracinaceae bacterium]|nr:GTP cyclohydrolase II [Sandaracinaceae bacterium]